MTDPITTAVATEVAKAATAHSLKGAWEYLKKKWSKKESVPPIAELQKVISILFIDDEDRAARVDPIRKAGWNVNQINEVTDYYANEINRADIIFLDYSGVGANLSEEQGIGLLKSIRIRHPKKYLIFYSGAAGFMEGHKVFSFTDDWINKHADVSEYLDHIEAGAKVAYERRRQ